MLLTSALVSLSLLAGATDDGRLQVAIMDIRGAEGVPESMASAVMALVADDLVSTGAFSVVTREDIQKLIDFEADKMQLGCESDASCLAEIGDALGVPYLVSGTLNAIATSLVLELVLLDVSRAKVLGRKSGPLVPDRIRESIHALTTPLAQPLLREQAGKLSVTANERGVTLRIDDTVIGEAPVQDHPVNAGRHELVASKTGFVQQRVVVEVKPREGTEQHLVLVPSREFIADYRASAGGARVLSWSLIGTGLLAGGASAGLFAWNELEVTGLRQETGIPLGQPVPVDASVLQGQFARDIAGFSLAGLALLTAATGTILLAVGDDPSRYDLLVAQ